MRILAVGNPDDLAAWAYLNFQVSVPCVNLAVAIVEGNEIIAAAFFQAHNGPDVELSYYGPRTMTLDVVKGLAKIAVDHLGVSRVTVRTAKNNRIMTKGIKKIGFEYEGIRKMGYGNHDAVMFGLYGRRLAKLAGKVIQ